jgi:hypothetical protein
MSKKIGSRCRVAQTSILGVFVSRSYPPDTSAEPSARPGANRADPTHREYDEDVDATTAQICRRRSQPNRERLFVALLHRKPKGGRSRLGGST